MFRAISYATISILVFGGHVAVQRVPESRTLHLSVKDVNGKGEPHVGYVLRTSKLRIFHETDADGKADFTFSIDRDDQTVKLSFEDGATANWSATESIERQRKIFELLASKYYAYVDREAWRMIIPLRDGQSDYDLNLVLKPAIAISGTVSDEKEMHPIARASIRSRWSSESRSRTDPNGRFTLRGVPKGEGNELFVISFPLVTSIPIAPANAESDFSVGIVPMRDLKREVVGKADIRSPGMTLIEDSSGRTLGGGATLISSHGKTILSLLLGNKSRMIAENMQEPAATLPIGTYVVVPGAFDVGEIQLAVRDALLAGRDLSKSGIPILTVKENETTSLEFNAVEVANAIRKIMTAPGATTQPATSAPASSR